MKEVLHQEDILQAVVVADSFNERFRPLTYMKPKVLLPLVNRPVIDYCLECLSICGIQEVFLFCCSHAQQIREYIEKSKWGSGNGMSIQVFSSETYLSIGDVLRELDGKAVIRSDFILMRGDVIAHLLLADIVGLHRKFRQRDKGTVMTMIFREALPNHKSRCIEDEVVVTVDSNTNRILHYQKIGNQKSLKLPLEIFQENSEATIRYDLMDSHICICSAQVPPLFADNFDYQTEEDFVKGLLINEEVLGNSIYMHVTNKGYSAKISNLYMYDAVSKDIIRRWTYPLVPDVLSSIDKLYTYQRHNIYKQGDVDLAWGCVLKENVVVGNGTKIGSNSVIVNSVIGRNCQIGKDVYIEGSYLWDDVIVEDGCQLNTCLLASGVKLKPNVKVKPGSVLSYKVVVGPSVELPDRILLQSESFLPNDDFMDIHNANVISNASDPKLVGTEGYGFVYLPPCGSDSEESDIIQDIWGLPADSDNDYDDEQSVAHSFCIDEIDDPNPADDTKIFYGEVLDSLIRGFEEKLNCDNLILEVNSSKHAYNITMKEVNMLVIKAILNIPEHKLDKTLKIQEYFKSLVSLFKHFMPLINNYIKSNESQMDSLTAIEEFMIEHKEKVSMEHKEKTPFSGINKILHYLYDKDVINEDVILEWYKYPPPLNDFDHGEQEAIRKEVLPFIKWLQEAEEESSDE